MVAPADILRLGSARGNPGGHPALLVFSPKALRVISVLYPGPSMPAPEGSRRVSMSLVSASNAEVPQVELEVGLCPLPRFVG